MNFAMWIKSQFRKLHLKNSKREKRQTIDCEKISTVCTPDKTIKNIRINKEFLQTKKKKTNRYKTISNQFYQALPKGVYTNGQSLLKDQILNIFSYQQNGNCNHSEKTPPMVQNVKN